MVIAAKSDLSLALGQKDWKKGTVGISVFPTPSRRCLESEFEALAAEI